MDNTFNCLDLTYVKQRVIDQMYIYSDEGNYPLHNFIIHEDDLPPNYTLYQWEDRGYEVVNICGD